MAFWNLASSEPRRQHRFLLSIPLLEGYEQYLAKTVTKPAYTISETEHKFLGNTYYYPGAVTWDPVTVQLVNAVNPDGNLSLYKALYNSGYLSPDQAADVFGINALGLGAGTPNKMNALGSLGSIIITEINGDGGTIGTWQLNNPWLTNVKFGDLDYSGEDLLNIDMTIRYDWASYGSGDGPPVSHVVDNAFDSVVGLSTQEI
tara:strand:- start:9898 stop:10506 length:609 start_codon:yes stop_codon:yes gene_type:complete